MEILFMVFMVVVSIMALFAVMVVFRDVINEVLASRRERDANTASIVAQAERIIAEAKTKEEIAAAVAEATAAKAAEAPAAKVAEPIVEEPVVEEPAVEEPVVEEAPAEEPAVEEPAVEEPAVEEPAAEEAPAEEPAAEAEAEAEDAEGTISFATGAQKTLDEKYLELPMEQRRWYDEIIKYASAVEGSKRFKNARYEEYKVGKNRLVRLLIKRGTIQCEFILHNSDFKNYVNENKISVRQGTTVMLVEAAETVDAVKNSIDIVVAFIAEEKEYKKQQARERRRAARAEKAAAEAAEAGVGSTESEE